VLGEDPLDRGGLVDLANDRGRRRRVERERGRGVLGFAEEPRAPPEAMGLRTDWAPPARPAATVFGAPVPVPPFAAGPMSSPGSA
jgi:hypothetical protein